MSGEDRSPPTTARTGFPGAQWLADAEPEAVLRRIAEGDPLDLRARTARRLRICALLLDPDRVYELSLTRTAERAPSYRGDPPLGNWLDGRIDDAIASALRTDAEAEATGVPAVDPSDGRQEFLSAAFGIPAAFARPASVAFNRLPFETRKAFFEVAVDGKSPKQCAQEGRGDLDDLRAKVRRGLRALSILDDPAEPSSAEDAS